MSSSMPPGLGKAGKQAYERALVALEGRDISSQLELIERYARAVDMTAHLYELWDDEDKPAFIKGGATGKADVANPLVKMIQDGERSAAQFWGQLFPDVKRPVGRPRGSGQVGKAAPPKFTPKDN